MTLPPHNNPASKGLTMSSSKGKPGTKGTSKKPKAARASPKAEASPPPRANGDCQDGLYRCDACNSGHIRGAASLSFHKKRLCPVLKRENLFNCDVCGLGIFRGKSSLDLHKRHFCKGVWREKYREADDSDSEARFEEEVTACNGRAEEDRSDEEESNFVPKFDEDRKEEDMEYEYQDGHGYHAEVDDGGEYAGNHGGTYDDDDDEEFFKTY